MYVNKSKNDNWLINTYRNIQEIILKLQILGAQRVERQRIPPGLLIPHINNQIIAF